MADEAEQLNESITADEDNLVIDPSESESSGELEENEIVLAGQESEEQPKPKDPKSYILKRFEKKNDKLRNENAALKEQLTKAAVNAPVDAAPDEYSYDDRSDYLRDLAIHQRKIMQGVVNEQLENQQNGHRIAAQEQEQEKALTTYAENAAKLKVSDFNEAQDKACEILGDDFAQLIVQSLPDEAAKLLYWFGKNPSEAADYRENYTLNPGRTTFSLGMLAGKLTIKPKRSNAALPESKPNAGAVGGGNQDWQKQFDKINDAATPETISKTLNARRALKAQAKAAGYDVSTLN